MEDESQTELSRRRPESLYLGRPSGPDEGFPFFAEYPYFLWGEVNYDSDGNCKRPTDRRWSRLSLQNRETGATVDIGFVKTAANSYFLEVSGSSSLDVCLAAYLTSLRSGCAVLDVRDGGIALVQPDTHLQWTGDVAERLQAANRIQDMFLDTKLSPFDSHNWWGGWKWVGNFSTDLTSGLRVIMDAVHTGHADPEVLDWMRHVTAKPFHREGLNYALRVLTGATPGTTEISRLALPDFLKAGASITPRSRPWWKFWER